MQRSGKQLSARARKQRIVGYAFIIPNLVGFVLFNAYPTVYGLVLSFMRNKTLREYTFVGLENFQQMLTDKYISIALKNNLAYSFTTVPATILLALLCSVLVYNLGRKGGFFRNALFLPHITASIAVATVWKTMFLPDKGLINVILHQFGISNTPRWLISTKTALFSIGIVSVWQKLGYTMLFILVGLQGVPKELYEVGDLEGATGWKRFRFITFPLISPSLFFVLITNMIDSFKVYDLILQMTEGGPANSTIVLVYRIYQEGILRLNTGYSSAIAMLLLGLVLIVTAIQFVFERKWVYYSDAA